jgi:hypothetical protein
MIGKNSKLSDRKFWRIVSQTRGRLFSFKMEYHKWLWGKSKIKQHIIELYRIGWNQLEIASTFSISPLKVRRILKKSRKSLEWYIRTNKLLEE